MPLAIAREEDRPAPQPFAAQLLPVAHEYATVGAVRAAVLAHDDGSIYEGALLAERMRWNPRIFSALQTRANGLTATGIRWRAARENRDGRRVLAAWREDYPRMVSTATRQQRAWHGLILGLDFAQRAPEWHAGRGRWLFCLRPFWPGWATWDDSRQAYYMQTGDGRHEYVPSPSMGGVIDPSRSPWYVYEPNGPYSWRWGLIHPLWYAWFGLDRCVRDGFRWSEKHGLGIMKAFIPDGSGDEYQAARDNFITRLRSMGREGVIPCRRGQAGSDEGDFDVAPLEFSGGAGFAGIEGTRNSTNVDIAVATLGHNLTTEVKGGSFAAANVGDYIRGDLKAHDVTGEIAHDEAQLGRPWSLANFGDPDLAPIGDGEADPPAADQAAAGTLQSLAQALASMPAEIRAVMDVEALLDRFRIALRAGVQVPRATGDQEPAEGDAEAPAVETPPAAPEAPTGEAARPETPAAQMALALTPTDLAAAVRLDEVRRAIGQSPVGGEMGARWMAEHAAAVRDAAGLPPEPGGMAPSGPPPPGDDDDDDDTLPGPVPDEEEGDA